MYSVKATGWENQDQSNILRNSPPTLQQSQRLSNEKILSGGRG